MKIEKFVEKEFSMQIQASRIQFNDFDYVLKDGKMKFRPKKSKER